MNRQCWHVPLLHLHTAEEALTLRPPPLSLLVDVEGTLTEFAPSPQAWRGALETFDAAAAEHGFDLRRVHYVSNAQLERAREGQWGAGRLHFRAGKPFFVPPDDFRRSAATTLVIGDQYLTDGLLAWRFGFSFGLVSAQVPTRCWPRFQSIVGRALVGCLFRPRA